jgi:serine phosphatase RsbU (regulator of sigma subunit)
LNAMDRLVRATLNRREKSPLYDDGLDMAVCRVDRGARTLEFAGAGLSLFQVGNGEPEEIRGERQSIGYRSSRTEYLFTSHRLPLDSPLCLYMVTDGLIGQPGEESKVPFGKRRLIEFLAQNHSRPFPEQKERLWELFNRYKGSESQRDDITAIGFRV